MEKEINKRVREVRNKEKLTQESMAKKISIKQSSFSDIENGRVNVSERVIADICRVFNVNERWLRYGEGSMYNSLNKEDIIINSVNKILKSENEFIKNLFIAIGNLSDNELEVVEKLVHDVATGNFKLDSFNDKSSNDIDTNKNIENEIIATNEVSIPFKEFVSINPCMQELSEELQWICFRAFNEEKIKATLTEEQKRKLLS